MHIPCHNRLNAYHHSRSITKTLASRKVSHIKNGGVGIISINVLVFIWYELLTDTIWCSLSVVVMHTHIVFSHNENISGESRKLSVKVSECMSWTNQKCGHFQNTTICRFWSTGWMMCTMQIGCAVNKDHWNLRQIFHSA